MTKEQAQLAVYGVWEKHMGRPLTADEREEVTKNVLFPMLVDMVMEEVGKVEGKYLPRGGFF